VKAPANKIIDPIWNMTHTELLIILEMTNNSATKLLEGGALMLAIQSKNQKIRINGVNCTDPEFIKIFRDPERE